MEHSIYKYIVYVLCKLILTITSINGYGFSLNATLIAIKQVGKKVATGIAANEKKRVDQH